MNTTGKSMAKHSSVRVWVALENVRSAHNVGAIMRTCDAAGVAGIFLVGTTPAPIDRFGRTQPDIAKTALGAEMSVPWTYFANTEALLAHAHTNHLQCIAVEQDARSVDYKSVTLSRDAMIILGNEVDGVSDRALAAADTIMHIPMRGIKESLNVSTAAGVVLYHLLD